MTVCTESLTHTSMVSFIENDEKRSCTLIFIFEVAYPYSPIRTKHIDIGLSNALDRSKASTISWISKVLLTIIFFSHFREVDLIFIDGRFTRSRSLVAQFWILGIPKFTPSEYPSLEMYYDAKRNSLLGPHSRVWGRVCCPFTRCVLEL